MLFFTSSRKGRHTDFREVCLDMHSHIIPGVDDGAKDITDSLALMNGLKKLGFDHLFTTPHTQQDIHPNTKEGLEKAHALLNCKIPKGLTLRLSSEYYLDNQFRLQLEAGAVMPLPGNRLLIECNKFIKPYDLEDRIFDVIVRGFQPILSHPERYLFFHSRFGYYKRLKKLGVELQLSALSLTDYYGKNVRRISEQLIKEDMIDFIGTDTHNLKHIETLIEVPRNKYFARLLDSKLLKNHELI